MGVVLLYAYRASYVIFIQHTSMSELYFISLNEYPPEVIVSNVISHYQILQIYHLSMYSQHQPNPHQDIYFANDAIPFYVISVVSCGRDIVLL